MNFITWNMQGATGFRESKWTTDITRLLQMGAEVLCLQEAGVPPPTAVAIPPPAWIANTAPAGIPWAFLQWNLGSRSRARYVYIFWMQTDPGANRNNLAIVSTQIPNGLIAVNGGLPGARPSIGIQMGIGGTNVNIYSLHAFSGGGGNAPNLINNINAVGGPWFALGDYNRPPVSWGGIALPPGTTGCPHNGRTTHPGSGTNLDYSFKNPGPAIEGEVLDNFIVSDHYPVLYQTN